MIAHQLVAVTGAFGFTGKFITRRLLKNGYKVITLTGHPDRPNEFGNKVRAFPYDFTHPEKLVKYLRGVHTLYNTYWVRFEHTVSTFAGAVDNTCTMIQAAKAAGVKRFVQISVTNPSFDSPLPYFRGKAQVEAVVKSSGLSYAIIRPTLIYGRGDILINNIAHLLRRFPFFVIPGSGDYRLQPVYAEDLSSLCIQAAEGDDLVIDAAGHELFTFNELVKLIKQSINGRAKIVHASPEIALALANLIGYWKKDVVLILDEFAGLSEDLLVSSHPIIGTTNFADWLHNSREWLGQEYASELSRHF